MQTNIPRLTPWTPPRYPCLTTKSLQGNGRSYFVVRLPSIGGWVAFESVRRWRRDRPLEWATTRSELTPWTSSWYPNYDDVDPENVDGCVTSEFKKSVTSTIGYQEEWRRKKSLRAASSYILDRANSDSINWHGSRCQKLDLKVVISHTQVWPSESNTIKPLLF